MSSNQLLIYVECNKKSKTDQLYIEKVLSEFYEKTNDFLISFKYLDGKTKYNKINNNENNKKDIVLRGTIVCIDLDDSSVNQEQAKLNNEIKKYCQKNNYDLVIFNKDIEHVFNDKQCNKNEKVKFSKIFYKNKIPTGLIQKLCSEKVSLGRSNLVLILDKYLQRKS